MSLSRFAGDDSKLENDAGAVQKGQLGIRVFQDLRVTNVPEPAARNHALDYLSPPEIDDRFLALVAKARCVCEKSSLEFRMLSTVQRKFVTHYRCPQCGLLPLYRLDLTHPKRVRCGKCRNTVPLRNSGKYGRLRKEIAIELWLAGQERGERYDRK